MFAARRRKARIISPSASIRRGERKIDITMDPEVPAEEKIALLMKANFDQLVSDDHQGRPVDALYSASEQG